MRSVSRILGCMLTLAVILSVVQVGPARGQMDLDVADNIAAATVLLSALITQTENGVTTDDKQCFLGSGSVVSPDGRYILTNHHVVSSLDAATSYAAEAEAALLEENPGRQVTVRVKEIVVSVVDTSNGFPDRRYRAEVVKPDAALDLAVLRISGDSPGRNHERPLRRPYLALDLGAVQPGQGVTLVGYPAVASSTTNDPGCAPVPADRSIQMFPGIVSGFAEVGDRLVVTASGSGGMSGGAAVNAAGQLIGVPAQIQQMAAGGGVVEVIPIERATAMLEAVIPGITTPTPTPIPTPIPPSLTSTPEPTLTATPEPSTPPSGVLRIFVKDERDEPLGGACFALAGSRRLTVCENDDADLDPRDGAVVVRGLPPGIYEVTQREAAAGHALAEGTEAAIAAGKSTSVTVMNPAVAPIATALPTATKEPVPMPISATATPFPTSTPESASTLGTYQSPTQEFTVSWDTSLWWEIPSPIQQSQGYLLLTNGTSQIEFWELLNYDALTCVKNWYFVASSNWQTISNLQWHLNESGLFEPSGDGNVAHAYFSGSWLNFNTGTWVPVTWMVQCQTLVPGATALQVVHAAPQGVFSREVPLVRDILATVSSPRW